MMHSKVKVGILLVALPVIFFFACSKYKDPPRADPDNPDIIALGPYCNDSRAVNYNWNFPGVPNDSVCVYPVDFFKGNWILQDVVLLPNGDTAQVLTRNLTFTATEDTTKTHLAVTGWCSGTTPFYTTANKYARADVDTFPGSSLGQFLCSNTDTLNGYFAKWSMADTAKLLPDTLKVELTITNAAGTTYHKGTAIKQ